MARFNGSGAFEKATALAVDAAGNVYVTGYTNFNPYHMNRIRLACATIKYDTNGNELWVARYEVPDNFSDYATALVLDAAGNVYVTGSNFGDVCHDQVRYQRQ